MPTESARPLLRVYLVPYPTFARILFPLLLLVPKAAMAAREFTSWEEFDLDHPVCERPIPLGIGRESFFEVANDVGGREQYNQLVRLFRGRKWSELASGIAEFRTLFESTPLREAVTFLEVQALFDQSLGGDEELERTAERKLRSALLLYPKSDLAPVLLATAGAHWLRTGNYQRSLAIYETGSTTFPKDPLSCTFLLGVAESQFLLHKWDTAAPAFDRVVAQCRNFRLRAAALIRRVDIDWALKRPGTDAAYEKLVADENPFIERFYQPLLANLGEIKYRQGDLKAAGHFFERYLTTERAENGCLPFVAKRLADMAARIGERPAKVVGRYLAVYEKYPKTDIGRLCYAHGLLSDPGLKAGGELDRRIRLVDAEVDLITDEDVRSRIYLEKGLTLLDLGQTSALNYLNNLKGKTRFSLEMGKTGTFIRQRLIALLESGVLVPLDSNNVEKTVELVYSDWLKGTPSADWAFQFYGKVVAEKFNALGEKGDLKEGFELVKRWQLSPLWPPSGPEKQVRVRIGGTLLNALYQAGADSGIALLVGESKSILDRVILPEYQIVDWYTQVLLRSPNARKEAESIERDLASLSKGLPTANSALFRLVTVQGLRLVGDLKGAQSALKGLDDTHWSSAVLRERIELAKARNQGERAFGLLKTALAGADAKKKLELLREMGDVLEQNKVWSLGSELIDVAREMVSDPQELGRYYHLAGRALSENKQCKQAIPLFENAFRMSPTSNLTAQSRFRMGKCWLSEKRPEAARAEWAKVIQMKDSFWSPLAQSEIALLSP